MLSGTIPSELADVTSMIGLSMARNQLTGTVPLELFQLPTLATLILVRTSLLTVTTQCVSSFASNP